MDKNLDSSVARGIRLRKLRHMIGLTSINLAKIAGLSRATISYWENASHGGLTRNGAEKITAIVSRLGVECDIGWLWFGVGQPPRLFQEKINLGDAVRNTIPHSIHKLLSSLEKEIELFLNLNSNSIIARVRDELMKPAFDMGDVVGGIWQSSHLFSDEKTCIIKLNDILVARNIKKVKDGFEISSVNKNLSKITLLKNTELLEVAPIIRVWRY